MDQGQLSGLTNFIWSIADGVLKDVEETQEYLWSENLDKAGW